MSQADVHPAEYPFSRKQILWGLIAIFAVYGTVAYSVQTMTIARPKIAADLALWKPITPSLRAR